jgi:ribose transport system permease protein
MAENANTRNAGFRNKTILRLTEAAERLGLPLLFVVLIVWFSVDSRTGTYFTSGPNIDQILVNQVVTAIVALAMVVPLVGGYFDLSVPAVTGISSIAFAHVIGPSGHSIITGVVVALLMSVIFGCFTGYLVAVLRLNGFIVTLGIYTLMQGLLQWNTNGQTITEGIPTSLIEWGYSEILGIPAPFVVCIGIAVVTWYFLMHLPAGRELEAVGSNEEAARLVGIRVTRNVFVAFIASSLLAGVAGIVLTARAGSADPTSGPSYLFPALAAVFLGATCFRPGKYNVWGTLVGVYFLAVAVNGLTFLGADAWITPAFNGAALILAVLLSTLMGREREGRKQAPEPAPVGSDQSGPDPRPSEIDCTEIPLGAR